MTLAQVQGFTALIFALIATWASLLVAVSLLATGKVAVAEETLLARPFRSFLWGLVGLLPAAIGVKLIQEPPPLGKLFGVLLMLVVAALLLLGASAVAQIIARRGRLAGPEHLDISSLVRGALIFTLGLAFPLIGWYLFLPVSFICAIGAGLTVSFHGRAPVHTIRDLDVIHGQTSVS